VPLAALGVVAWLVVRALTQGGTDITIMFTNVHGVKKDTDIMYRGLKVGSVTAVSLTPDGSAVHVSAHMQDSASSFLTTGTVFWLQGAQPSLSNLASLSAILSGPNIVMEPGAGASSTHFNGLVHQPLPANHGAPVLYTVAFEGAVGELSAGDAVTVRGFPVGEVQAIGFHYDAATGRIDTPVMLALYPDLFHIQGATRPESAEALRAALTQLVEAGLRARLEREPPLIGSYRVTLEMVPGAPAAEVHLAKDVPEIPTAPGGGLDSIVTRFKDIPIDQIAQNVLAITQHVDTLVSSPKLTDSIVQLDASLRDVHTVVQEVGPQVDKLVQALRHTMGQLEQTAQATLRDVHTMVQEVGPQVGQLVQALRHTAEQLEQTAQAADKTLGGAPSQTGFNDTLREIKAAARAVRSLADYLDQHPEALITGRPGK
jgi:paraquat-inducible protein B